MPASPFSVTAKKYGAPRDGIGTPNGGIALYSYQLELDHPVTHEHLTFTSHLQL